MRNNNSFVQYEWDTKSLTCRKYAVLISIYVCLALTYKATQVQIEKKEKK